LRKQWKANLWDARIAITIAVKHVQTNVHILAKVFALQIVSHLVLEVVVEVAEAVVVGVAKTLVKEVARDVVPIIVLVHVDQDAH
jgi:hypothetical protein